MKDIRLLLVEDNPADARLVTEMLRDCPEPGFSLVRAESLGDALSKLKDDLFDAVLLDLDLPDSRGLETLDGIRSSLSDPPVIVLTGSGNENLGVRAIRSRAADYLVKDKINADLLIRSVRYAIERKRIERVLRENEREMKKVLTRDKEELEELVLARTKDLLAAREEIERSKRLSDIGTLAATVAHELRNPLAAIRFACHNLKRKLGDAAPKSHIQTIENKIIESDQIIGNLLFYSRIRTPQYEPVRLSDIVREVVETAKGRVGNKEIRLDVKLDAVNGLTLEADPLQLRELLANLLNNAADAVSEGSGAVEIGARPDGREDVLIYVRDNGVGIEEENLNKIWEPFFSTKSKGTGLGLSVCRQIVSLHKGTVGIDSVKGAGTTVTVTLPLK